MILTFTTGTILTFWSVKRESVRMREQLLMEGRIVANAINWRFVERLNGDSTDLSSPEYHRLKEQLSLVCSAHPSARFVYLMGQQPDGSIFFFVDSESPESEDYSPPGEQYPEASETMKRMFTTGIEATEGPIPDRWGSWVSCLIPLNEPSTGEVLALLGMDISASRWNLELIRSGVIPGSVTLLLLIIEITMFLLRRRTQQENIDLKQSQETLRERELIFRTIAENAQAVIFILDPEGKFILSEGLALPKLGLKPGQVVGMSSLEMYKDYPDVILGIQKALRGEGQRSTVNVQGVVFDTLFSPVMNPQGEISMVIGIATDTTELVLAKDKAEESDRLKSAFLANMSHEIRTPMNGIVGFAQLLKDPSFSEQEKLHFIDIINKNANDLLSIIHDIVDISKIEAGQESLREEAVDLDLMLDDLGHSFRASATERDLQLLFIQEVPEETRWIMCDPVKISQILKNLLTNAIKFTDKGEVSLTSAVRDGNLMFIVKDTGVGIAKEFHEIIFDRFMQADSPQTTRYRGTGLGLAISRAYAEMMGGRIWLDSEPGKGSQFYVEIPLKTAALSPEIRKERTEAASDSKPDWSGKTILMVEDEEDNASFFLEVLKQTGVTVWWAKTGLEAIEMFENHPETNLVVMDIKLPEMNGLEVTRRMKSQRPEIPVIATTAFALAGDRERCLEAGCDDYFTKPVRIRIFLDTLARYIK